MPETILSDRPSPTTEAYEPLVEAYEFFNQKLFESKLPGCLITYQRKKSTLGYYSRRRFIAGDGSSADEIAMNPTFFAVSPIESVLATLVHEMCHQYQEHFGTPGRRKYHNAEFAQIMQDVGLQVSTTGRKGGKTVGERMSHYIIPDAGFIMAARELIATDFALRWFDRYPRASFTPTLIGGEEADSEDDADDFEEDDEEGGELRPEDTSPTTMDGTLEDASAKSKPTEGTPRDEPVASMPESNLNGRADTITMRVSEDGDESPPSTQDADSDVLDSDILKGGGQRGLPTKPSSKQPEPPPPKQKATLSKPPSLPGLRQEDLLDPAPARTTRTKFVCPGCGDAAWGKPSLELGCRRCDEALVPQ